jgi:hypothetical protein
MRIFRDARIKSGHDEGGDTPLLLHGRAVHVVLDGDLQDAAEGTDELVVADHDSQIDHPLIAERIADFLE